VRFPPVKNHGYEVPLAPGQWVRLSLKIRGLGAELRIVAPDGSLIARRAARSGTEETISQVGVCRKDRGAHRIEIRAVPWGQRGHYDLSVTDILAPERSRARIAENAGCAGRNGPLVFCSFDSLQTAVPGTGTRDLRPLHPVDRERPHRRDGRGHSRDS